MWRSLVSEIKEKYGMEVNVWTDVALDPYSDQGHDGMVSNDKRGDGGSKTQTIDHNEFSQPS